LYAREFINLKDSKRLQFYHYKYQQKHSHDKFQFIL